MIRSLINILKFELGKVHTDMQNTYQAEINFLCRTESNKKSVE